MANKQLLVPAVAAAAAGAVWYLWGRGGVPELSMDERAFTDISYQPYAHWRIHREAGAALIRHYPDRVGPNTLPQALSEIEGSLSTRRGFVDG